MYGFLLLLLFYSSEDEEFSSPFFPSKVKSIKRIDLSDTFSIQEMIESDESDGESGDSQNLELLPPNVRVKFIDKLINYFCCSSSSSSWVFRCVFTIFRRISHKCNLEQRLFRLKSIRMNEKINKNKTTNNRNVLNRHGSWTFLHFYIMMKILTIRIIWKSKWTFTTE